MKDLKYRHFLIELLFVDAFKLYRFYVSN